MCGIKIRKFIDRINSRTRIVNRLINLSLDIYTEENERTLAEIIITVLENIIPIGSNTNVNIRFVFIKYMRFHSIIIIFLVIED